MNEPICTFALIVITTVATLLVFRDRSLEPKFIFWPEAILAGKEYYRLVTSAFLHADGWHLMVNMMTLYLFGRLIEYSYGAVQLCLIYFGAIVGGSLLSLLVHRHHDYRAYGASGGTCGLVLAYILLFPGGSVRMFYFPISVPGWAYALGYIAYSFWGIRESHGNIGHDAHLGGAILGLLVAAGLHPSAVVSHPGLFALVMVPATLALVYLWKNPLFLPLSTFVGQPRWFSRRPKSRPPPRPESKEVDAILDKIARKGIHSLTPEEKALLATVSGKYQRRAESEKPQSGLTF